MAKTQVIDYTVDLLQSILWQYNEAARLQSLLEQKQAWYDVNQTAFWTDWQRDVFNLQTANDFGLQVWAIILNIPLTVTITPGSTATPSWAFEDFRENYENGNFYQQFAGAQPLTREQARLVLRLRYFQLTTKGAVTGINEFMKYLFGDLGDVFVLDGLDMTCQYTFTFPLPSALQFIFQRYDLLPRPAGVGVDVVVSVVETWGFDEYHENFDNGNFSEL